MTHFSKILLPLGLATALLAGCASPAVYAPRVKGAETGYTDRELTPNRYRVTFTGNSVTPRETVENYLLLRAAEITLANGGEYFMFDGRDTKAKTRVYADAVGPDPYFGGYGGFYGSWHFRPRWGYGAGFGYGPYGGGFGPDVMITQSTKYESFAEIVLLKPGQEKSEPRAINAREIVAHLSPPPASPT